MCVLGRWGQVGGACHLEQMEAGEKREEVKKKLCSVLASCLCFFGDNHCLLLH